MSDRHGIDDPYHGHSFVVRIWWEKGHDDQALWRGWVQHAITGKSRYFDHVADMLAFIEAHTGRLVKPVSEIRKR